MKNQEAVKIWGNEEAILAGRIKLEQGQLVDCGCNEQHPTLSKFVALDGGVMIIAHGGSDKEVIQKYRTMVAARRGHFI